MPYSFRNRDEIRAPSRLDDPEDEHRRASYREPDIDEEVYRSSPPKSTRNKYRGPITHFNSNLPPAAFPTLDDPKLAPHQQPQTIESESSSSASSIAGSPQGGRNDQVDRNGGTPLFPTEDSPLWVNPNTTSLRATPPNSAKPTSDHSNRRTMGKDMSWLRGLKPQHNGRPECFLEDNHRRMYAAGKLTSFDRNMLEMMSSEDEDEEDAREQPEKEVHWDDLTVGLKLQLYDVVSDAYSSEEATRRLQLKDCQVKELAGVVLARNERVQRENEEGSRHRDELHERLLRGARMSEEKFRELLDLNLFQHVREDNDDEFYDNGFISQAAEVEKASLYLRKCRLDSKLLDGAWVSIPEANIIVLGRAKGDGTSVSGSMQPCRRSTGKTYGQHTSQPTPTRSHPPKNSPYDASDVSRSPSKAPRLHVRQRTPPSIQRSHQVQREHSRGRQPSGFIRPSIDLGEPTVTEPRLPPVGDFVHRTDLVRIELIRARKAAMEAKRAGIDRQANEAKSKGTAMERKGAPSAHRGQGLKRHASNDSETSFLTNERRAGARQPKLTEKAVKAEIASQLQSSATSHKKKRTSDGSTRKKTVSEGSVNPREAGRQAGGAKIGASPTNLQKPTASDNMTGGHASAESTSCAMMRKDSAIDLTADGDDDKDELA